jgi:hypothetical protein
VRVVLGSLLLAACARMPLAAAQSVPLGQTFPLKVGQSITVEADGLEVVFERVVSDSRCPRGVQCIRAGEATISVAAEKAPAARAAIELRTVASAAEAAYGPYRIRLLSLNPYPDANRRVEPDEYQAVLVVTRPQP